MNSSEWYMALAGVFWLGMQTSICPCPLTTNIAAISYIGRKAGRPGETVASGILYASGQILAYLCLSFVVLVLPIFSGDQLTRFFSSTLHVVMGPILILIGMVLSGLIHFSLPSINGERMKIMVDRLGFWSAFPLGVLFALAFCPTTAAMFLAMIFVSAKAESIFFFPLAFSIGMVLPVVFFALLFAFQVHWIGKVFNAVKKMEVGMRLFAGTVFILAGVFLTVRMSWALM